MNFVGVTADHPAGTPMAMRVGGNIRVTTTEPAPMMVLAADVNVGQQDHILG
jgi:hypothetical protein